MVYLAFLEGIFSTTNLFRICNFHAIFEEVFKREHLIARIHSETTLERKIGGGNPFLVVYLLDSYRNLQLLIKNFQLALYTKTKE